MLNKIATEMTNRGYVADVVTVTKNGIEMNGVVVGKGEACRPTFYESDFPTDKNIDDICDELEDRYEEVKTPDFDVNKMIDIDFMRDNAQLCIQKKGTENIIKRDYLDLELYVRCQLFKNEDGLATYKVPGKDEYEELIDVAIENTKDSFIIKSLSEMLDIPALEDDMYVVVNDNKSQAAACLYYPEVFKEFCEKYGFEKVFILPSSIHEIIIHPDNGGVEFNDLNNLVKKVNAEQVSPQEQLSDHAYYYTLADNKITY